MPRLTPALCLLFTFESLLAGPVQSGAGGHADTIVVRGCIGAGVLTPYDDADDPRGGPPLAPQYRLSGPKALLKELKRSHNGHFEEVTGRIRGQQAPAGTSHRGTVGKLGIVVGAPAGQTANHGVPEMPAFEVRSHRHLADGCERQ